MGEEHKIVNKYERKQRLLKKEIEIHKKRIPYYISGFLFFGIGLIGLLEEKLDHIVGNSYNLILVIMAIFVVTTIIFIIITYIKIYKKKRDSKKLGSKIFRLMKLR